MPKETLAGKKAEYLSISCKVDKNFGKFTVVQTYSSQSQLHYLQQFKIFYQSYLKELLRSTFKCKSSSTTRSMSRIRGVSLFRISWAKASFIYFDIKETRLIVIYCKVDGEIVQAVTTKRDSEKICWTVISANRRHEAINTKFGLHASQCHKMLLVGNG